jgi:periplasmic mercuric ion binding protein
MKTLSIFGALLLSLFTLKAHAQKTALTKETIKVWGNCGMCKTNIEKAAKKGGATIANWSEETHELNVSYVAAKTSSQKIQQSIANAGYDTQDLSANNGAYNKLHACCKYDRKENSASEAETAKPYCCSMHPEVKSDKPGKCSKCGMNLNLSEKEKMKMQAVKLYTCPMHADVTSDKAGKCSKCGMDLKKD